MIQFDDDDTKPENKLLFEINYKFEVIIVLNVT